MRTANPCLRRAASDHRSEALAAVTPIRSILLAVAILVSYTRVGIADDSPTPPTPSTVQNASAFTIGSKGFGFESVDGASSFYTHWFVAGDYQSFFSTPPPGVTSRDAFIVRTAGLQLDAVLHHFVHSQMFVDFSQSKATLFDAWVQLEGAVWLKLRVGKFQFPISEERLTPPLALPFVSTGFASMLLPTRDVGVEVLGDIGDGAIGYNLAVTNGAIAGTLEESDLDAGKDAVGRIFVRPFRGGCWAPIEKLGVGFGASTGEHRGVTSAPNLPILRTYGNQVFFSYRADPGGTALADGRVTRLVPHATWAWGPVAAYADYVHVIEHVAGATVRTDGWSVIPSLVLTGENASPLSFILPKHPFDLAKHQIGTILITGGVGSIHVSDDAFASAANPEVAMQRATVYGGGANWYPFAGIAVLVDYGYLRFTPFGGYPVRPTEQTMIARLEMAM
jgi:phosphate-selective porin OprO/OprP